MQLGCHLSIAKGLPKSLEMAGEVKANTFQFFTRNPRGGSARKITTRERDKWKELRKKEELYPVVGHLPYTLNLAAPREEVHSFTSRVLLEDLNRMEEIDAEYLVLHPGSHVSLGREKGILRIIKALEDSLLQFKGSSMLLLETMAGQGTEIGTLKDIKEIMDSLGNPYNLGVCLDTCHLFAAGYDFREKEDVQRLIDDLEFLVGLDKARVFHLSDSKYPLGSKKDRHQLIGKGYLQKEGLLNVLKAPPFKDLPFILETPVKNYLQYGDEIKLIRDWLRAG
ncbi:MAG: deoxyribonuclease IV [Candidatus Syntrophonatronum acetioxidans]|uniref:Probable endonuclease 4 n=1 Tax=Candidatus Syntrophonatronum acetioxidans TaxID=1795816 RepID=A0A424YFF9_9FIRM|nr:MAG: deoxyribonuclease IV [Candidatus Syntrophonatronum acetioxidans]